MDNDKMKIAVLSGKGGTGKTFLAVNLAAAAEKAMYVDCDVEEPNGHLFFRPDNAASENVSVMVPEVRKELCNGCRTCVDFCKFNALAFIKNTPLVFPDICHSCGGCTVLCPEGAMLEKSKTIGQIHTGTSDTVKVVSGIMQTGEFSGVPIIEKLIKITDKDPGLVVLDCPPGSACIVMESIKNADYCILVAEPTIFGADNLRMVYELVKLFQKPCGVVLNKCMETENPSQEFCHRHQLNILARIPFSNELGALNSQGKIAVRVQPAYRAKFQELWQTVAEEVQHEKTVDS